MFIYCAAGLNCGVGCCWLVSIGARIGIVHGFALPPDGGNNDNVAGADQNGGDEEEGDGHRGDVDLPDPFVIVAFSKFHPALDTKNFVLLDEEKNQIGQRKEETEPPSGGHQDPRALPASTEVHGMGDGVVAVNAERHQDVG